MELLLHHQPPPPLDFSSCSISVEQVTHSWRFWQSVPQTGESCRRSSAWLTRWWTANLKTSCPDHTAICRSQFNSQMRLWLEYERFFHFGFLPLWVFYPFAAAFVTASAFGVVKRSRRQTAGMIYWRAHGEDTARSTESYKELLCWLTAKTHWHFVHSSMG